MCLRMLLFSMLVFVHRWWWWWCWTVVVAVAVNLWWLSTGLHTIMRFDTFQHTKHIHTLTQTKCWLFWCERRNEEKGKATTTALIFSCFVMHFKWNDRDRNLLLQINIAHTLSKKTHTTTKRNETKHNARVKEEEEERRRRKNMHTMNNTTSHGSKKENRSQSYCVQCK